ncbi:hypothetical protein ACNKHP_24345 [Shigella boydii]
MLEATGLQLPLGATCVIERQNGSETHEAKAKSLALTVNGCFYAAGGKSRCPARRAGLCQKHFGWLNCKAASSCRSVRRYEVAFLDGSGKPLDGLPSPIRRKPVRADYPAI